MSEIFGAKNYKEQLKGLCCVEISGESCAGCVHLLPILKTLTERRGDMRFICIEANYETVELMQEWDVSRVPTVLLMDDGKIFARCAGYQPEEILELWLDSKVDEYKAQKEKSAL